MMVMVFAPQHFVQAGTHDRDTRVPGQERECGDSVVHRRGRSAIYCNTIANVTGPCGGVNPRPVRGPKNPVPALSGFHLHGAMIVAMIPVRMVEMPVDQVVSMVAVGDRRMPAVRAMHALVLCCVWPCFRSRHRGDGLLQPACQFSLFSGKTSRGSLHQHYAARQRVCKLDRADPRRQPSSFFLSVKPNPPRRDSQQGAGRRCGSRRAVHATPGKRKDGLPFIDD